MKLPYDSIAMVADSLVMLAVVSPEPRTYMDEYHDFLMSCGWTDRDFDQETLRRVDAAWERLHRKPTTWN